MDGSRVPKTGGATGPAARPRRRSRDGAVDRARRRAGARPRPRRAETKAISNRIVDKIGSISEQRHDGGRRHATSATATAKQFCRKRDPGGRECGGISHATLALPAGTHGRDRCRTRHCGSAAARRHDRRCPPQSGPPTGTSIASSSESTTVDSNDQVAARATGSRASVLDSALRRRATGSPFQSDLQPAQIRAASCR